MVGINKMINLGIAAAIIGGFFYLGGASGIGKHIGGGLTSFGSGIASSLKFPEFKFPTLGLPKTAEQTFENEGEYEKAIREAGGESNLTQQEKVDIAKTLLTPEELAGSSIAKEFNAVLGYGDVTQEFAKKYSFVAPKAGALDVSKIIGQFYNVTNRDYESRKASNFGGYGSVKNQQTALAAAIQESAAKYPEWFS